jgi:hypothetical protein
MPLHIFLSTWVGTSFGILEFSKVLKDIVLVGGFALAIGFSIRAPWFKSLLKDKLVWLITGYGVLTLLLALLKPTDQDAEILGIVYNLRFLIFFHYGLLLTYLFDAASVRHRALQIVMVVAVPVLILGVLQYTFLPDDALGHLGYERANGVLPAFFIDDKPDLERVMSSLRDPNSFGSYVIIILSLSLAYLLATKNRHIKKITTGLLGLGGLCLLFTFSRSALLGALLAVATIIGLTYRAKISKKMLAVGVSLILLALLMLYPLRHTYFVQNVIFHSDQSTVLEDPNQLRVRFWQESLESAVNEPLGHGPGTAGLASIRNEVQGTVLNENYYFQILYEAGITGLILFGTIIIIVARRLYLRTGDDTVALALFASFLGLAFTNFLVHIWSNEAVAYSWWGLAGLVLFTQSRKTRRAGVRK